MKALIADDDRGTIAILEKALKQVGLEVVSARDGSVAWDLLRSDQGLSVAILDWMMPGTDGLELCRRIRQDPNLASTYVILLTAREGRDDLVAGLEAGADDYIVKPFDFGELHARLRVGIRVATLQDRLAAQVSELRIARDRLERLASTDVLTDLSSRRHWYDVAAEEMRRFLRYGRPFSVVVVDLDFFKQINDTKGHAAGDEVLRQFTRLLREAGRESDVFGRVGGEEFAVLLPETPLPAARELADRVVTRCRGFVVQTPAGEVSFTCSAGVADVSSDDLLIDRVVDRADQALYDAKRRGRNGVAVWAAPRATPTAT